MQGVSKSYSESTEIDEEEKEKEKEKEDDGRPPVRKTLEGRIIGYTGMDPPAPFSSLTEDSTIPTIQSSRDNESVGLSRVEIEMIEFEKIKSLKRKRGTLKKKFKPTLNDIIE